MDSRPVKALLALLAASPVPVRRISLDKEGAISIELADPRAKRDETADDPRAIEKPRKRLSEFLKDTPPPFDFEVQ